MPAKKKLLPSPCPYPGCGLGNGTIRFIMSHKRRAVICQIIHYSSALYAAQKNSRKHVYKPVLKQTGGKVPHTFELDDYNLPEFRIKKRYKSYDSLKLTNRGFLDILLHGWNTRIRRSNERYRWSTRKQYKPVFQRKAIKLGSGSIKLIAAPPDGCRN